MSGGDGLKHSPDIKAEVVSAQGMFIMNVAIFIERYIFLISSPQIFPWLFQEKPTSLEK